MGWRKPKSVRVAGIGIACGLLLSACAVPRSYMGIEFDSSAVDGSIRELARKAQSGDKQAQLELGIAFEEGHGVARDITKALRLYLAAAADSGGPMWVYVPAAGGGTVGRVIQANSGPVRRGLPQAQARLSRLQQAELRR